MRGRGFFSKRLLVGVSLLVLTSCGGGGGGGGSAAATTPAPSGPPPGTPVAVSLPSQGVIYTNEYNNSTYLALIRADGAYLKGATGSGINIAQIDGGVVAANSELAGKVISRIDLTGTTPGGGAPEHGTAIASLMVAVRDGAGLMGVAYGARVYDLNVFQPGVGPGADPFATDSDIARALRVVAGTDPTYTGVNAKVVNMSLGGNAPFDPAVLAAMKQVVGLDKVIVLAAGNDGAAQPEGSARSAADPALQLHTIIVGSVTSNNVIAPFSNKAGAYANYYLVAPGVNLPAISDTGAPVTISGTSASTALVSASIAVLAQAFPFLRGDELVRLLKITATDLGDPGVDAVYGYGLINLNSAMNPVGPLSIPTGSTVEGSAVPLGSVYVTTGSVLGSVENGTLVALDSFNRPYDVGTSAVAGRSARGTLFNHFAGISGATVGSGMGSLLASWHMPRGAHLSLRSGNAVIGMSDTYAVALTDRVIGAVFRNARPSQLMAMQGFDPSTDRGQPLFTVTADNALPQAGFLGQGLSAVAYGFRGEDYLASIAYGAGWNAQAGQSSFMQASLAFKAAGIEWGIATSLLKEEDTVLGGYTSGSNLKGAFGRTIYTTLTASYPINSWRMDLAYTRATLDRGALATGFNLKGVEAEAMSFTILGPAGLREGDLLGFRMGQPLRASRGSVETFLPVGRSFSGDILRAPQRLGIRPDGREIDLELGYATPLPEVQIGQRADLRLNAFYARQPGNMRNAADALGAAVQFTLEW